MTREGNGLYSAMALRPVSGREKERLLYVEDDDESFRSAELRLRDGFVLSRATTGEEACSRLRAGSGWSAILMDTELRGSDLDGFELMKLLRGRLRGEPPAYALGMKPVETPIIFLTSQDSKHSEAALLLAGAEKVIAKPIEFGTLTLALTQLHLSRARQKRRTIA